MFNYKKWINFKTFKIDWYTIQWEDADKDIQGFKRHMHVDDMHSYAQDITYMVCRRIYRGRYSLN